MIHEDLLDLPQIKTILKLSAVKMLVFEGCLVKGMLQFLWALIRTAHNIIRNGAKGSWISSY